MLDETSQTGWVARNEMSRQLHLNVNGNGLAKPPNSWQHSDPPLWFLDFASWEKLGQIAERGLLDAVFLADVLPSADFTRPWHALDPFLTQTAVAKATTRIGLVATLSSTYREPFDVARLAATLDLAFGGRAGINVVTSGSDDAAALYGGGLAAGPRHPVRTGRVDPDRRQAALGLVGAGRANRQPAAGDRRR